MNSAQLAIYLRRLTTEMDRAIYVSRQEIAAAISNGTPEVLIDKTQDGFRPKEATPCIPALMPFEELSTSIEQDIKALLQEQQ
jgi:hypothetical protein